MRVLALSLLLWALPGTAAAQQQEFVTAVNGSFMAGDHRFEFVGANAYWLQQQASYGNTSCVEEVLDAYVRHGIRVVRIWGFADGWRGWTHDGDPAIMQAEPGILRERGMRALDYVVSEAKRRNLRVVIVLTNSWEDFGGIRQYVRWADERGYSSAGGPSRFYRDDVIRGWYRAYVRALIQRTNTITDVAYRDEPTILAWELANEPRVPSDTSGQILFDWLNEMSTFVKSIDPNHLVGTGEEGFDTNPDGYGDIHTEYGSQSWLFDGHEGASFSQNLRLPHIDYASLHLYPDQWLPDTLGTDALIGVGRRWIRDHLQKAAAAGKPLVLGEYGIPTDRAFAYDAWLTEAHTGDLAVAGSMAWDFTCAHRRSTSPYAFSDPDNTDIVGVLAAHAGRVNVRSHASGLQAGHELVEEHSLSISSAYPTPFVESTTIEFNLNRNGAVRADVYDLRGQLVVRLLNDHHPVGRHRMTWSGRNASGAYVATGAYWVRISTENEVESRMVVLAR